MGAPGSNNSFEEGELRRLLGLNKMDDNSLTYTEEGQAIVEGVSCEKTCQ
jgi:hypothetical protein